MKPLRALGLSAVEVPAGEHQPRLAAKLLAAFAQQRRDAIALEILLRADDRAMP